MKFLIDTSTLIYFDNDEKMLSKQALSIIQDKKNQIYLSVASIWEISIKVKLGKLSVEKEIEKLVVSIQNEYKIKILPITSEVIIKQHYLNEVKNHKDPFDKIIIAQAYLENMPVITSDKWFHNYPIKIIW